MTAQVGVIGLGVMGSNLALNLLDHGFRVAVYNDDTFGGTSANKFLDDQKCSPVAQSITASNSLQALAQSLVTPRVIVVFVLAGKPVDDIISKLKEFLQRGDIIVDCGNSNYLDTNRRCQDLASEGLRFVGCGVSGGEEGARKGPSLMPGGDASCWPTLQPLFTSIAAKAGNDPCACWIGDGGAGHYVKMVHNGIEYGDMQLLCEAYHFMRDGLGMGADEMHTVLEGWRKGPLQSFLVDITADILKTKDADGSALVENILDTAGQKGTGKWTGISSLEMGIPVTMITESVYARCVSAMKEKRVAASRVLSGPANDSPLPEGDKQAALKNLEEAVLAAKVVSYAQGFMLLRAAASEYGWHLDLPSIAGVWRAGCIIRSDMLTHMKKAFEKTPDLDCLVLDEYFRDLIHNTQQAWRSTVCKAVARGIPIPAMSSALSFWDSYRAPRLPANLLQAQRDYFGAHRYERVDQPRGKMFHTEWKSTA